MHCMFSVARRTYTTYSLHLQLAVATPVSVIVLVLPLEYHIQFKLIPHLATLFSQHTHFTCPYSSRMRWGAQYQLS